MLGAQLGDDERPELLVRPLAGRRWRLLVPISGADFTRDGVELTDPGLYVDLQPGQFYLLEVR